MEIYLADGNPIIAMVLTTLSTFKTTALTTSFDSISLSFSSEEAAKKFVEDWHILMQLISGHHSKV